VTPEFTTLSGLFLPVTVAGIDMMLLDLIAFLWSGVLLIVIRRAYLSRALAISDGEGD
jgi:hypothetical protein